MSGWRMSALPTALRARSRARSSSSPANSGEVATICSTRGWRRRTPGGSASGRSGTGRQPTTTRPSSERLGHQFPGQVALARLPRQEDHADRGRERPRLGDALLGEPRLEHAPGDRGEDAGAVRGFAVGADAAAVLHRGQRTEGEVDDLPAGLARDLRDEPDAAGAVLASDAAHRVPAPGLGARSGVPGGAWEVSAAGPVDRRTREVHRMRFIQVVLPGGDAWDIIAHPARAGHSPGLCRGAGPAGRPAGYPPDGRAARGPGPPAGSA